MEKANPRFCIGEKKEVKKAWNAQNNIIDYKDNFAVILFWREKEINRKGTSEIKEQINAQGVKYILQSSAPKVTEIQDRTNELIDTIDTQKIIENRSGKIVRRLFLQDNVVNKVAVTIVAPRLK